MRQRDYIIVSPRITVADIQRAVTRHYGLHDTDLRSDRRARRISHPRQMAMYLARELTECSLPMIGRLFGNRDHTTVMYALERVEARFPAAMSDYLALRDVLKNGRGTVLSAQPAQLPRHSTCCTRLEPRAAGRV